MKALGLDLGNKTLGIAISDINQTLSRPLSTIRFMEKDYQKAIDELIKLIDKEPIEVIILGLPHNMDGSLGHQSQEVFHFIELLKGKTSIIVKTYDERLTTKMAAQTMIHSGMNRKKRQYSIDQEAAAMLLQSYLDHNKKTGG